MTNKDLLLSKKNNKTITVIINICPVDHLSNYYSDNSFDGCNVYLEDKIKINNTALAIKEDSGYIVTSAGYTLNKIDSLPAENSASSTYTYTIQQGEVILLGDPKYNRDYGTDGILSQLLITQFNDSTILRESRIYYNDLDSVGNSDVIQDETEIYLYCPYENDCNVIKIYVGIARGYSTNPA